MQPTIGIARKACEAMRAHQVVIVAFDEQGRLTCVSYGATKSACAAVAPLCDEIYEKLLRGELKLPLDIP